MRHLINIVLILLLPFQVLSLDSINSKLLDHAKSIKASETDLNKIVDQLCTITKTEAEKAEIFFYWISQNIDYDVEAFLSGSYKFNKTDVLITKKGVCQHYSELFQEMCSLVNITCFIVDGYAKGFNDNPREPFDFTKANHAWNVIKLKEEYYFVDATWSSGHVNYVNYVTRELKYFRKINISNVITKSTSFRETHLPSDPAWQLNDTIVSTKSFARYRDYENMVKDPFGYNYNYLDSIEYYSDFSFNERNLNSISKKYEFNTNFDNRKQLISNYYYYLYEHLKETKEEEDLLKSLVYMNQAIRLNQPLIDSTQNLKEQRITKEQTIHFYEVVAYHLSTKGKSREILQKTVELYSKAYDDYEALYEYFEKEGLALLHEKRLREIRDNLSYAKVQYQLSKLKRRKK